MKKQNQSTKFPSFRANMEKRYSNNQLLLASTKAEFGAEITNEDQVLSSTQNEITKKIQSKLRVRKTLGSQKTFSREEEKINIIEKIAVETNQIQDFQSKIEDLWENSPEIDDIIAQFSSTVVPARLKERVMKQVGKLRCQSIDHSLEQLLVARVKKLCLLITSQQKCEEHQLLVSKLLDDRMRRLTDVLRTR